MNDGTENHQPSDQHLDEGDHDEQQGDAVSPLNRQVVPEFTTQVTAAVEHFYEGTNNHDVSADIHRGISSDITPLPSNFARVNETAATADVWAATTTQEDTDARLAEAIYQQELASLKAQYGGSYYCEGDAVALVEGDEHQQSAEAAMIPEGFANNDTGTQLRSDSFSACMDETQEAFVIESAPIPANQPLPASVLQTDRSSEPMPQRRRRRRTVTPAAIEEVPDENDQRYASLPNAPVLQDSKPPARRSPRATNRGNANRMGSIPENHVHEYIAQPALVLGIQEDVHPADGQHASAAEWIGSSTAVSEPMESNETFSPYQQFASIVADATSATSMMVSETATDASTVISEAVVTAVAESGSPSEAIAVEFESPNVTAVLESDSPAVATGSVVDAMGFPDSMPTATTIGEPMIADEHNEGPESADVDTEEYNDEYMLKQRVENVARAVPQESFADQSRESSLEYLHSSDRDYHQNIASAIAEAPDQTAPNNDPLDAANSSTHRTSIRDQLNALATDGLQSVSNSLSRSTSNAIEHIFGDIPTTLQQRRRSNSAADLAIHSVSSRTLLPWSVIRNPATGLWIATLQTNQRALDSNNISEASRSLRVFSMQTENQAICLSRAWTPPRMLDFSENKKCHICETKFAVLRRACHCRNCGVCICRDCSAQWPAKMVPETYNTKKEFFVNVCKSCNWLCNSFRQALLEGKRDEAVALFLTGNVNLYTPFGNVKGELFYPVHCAVLGNNLDLLRFLVDEHCCPIKSVNQSKGGRQLYTPIVTSRGRSLLGMAMEQENIEIVQYLIVEKNVDCTEEPDITREMLGHILTMALRGSLSMRQEAFHNMQQREIDSLLSSVEQESALLEPQPPSPDVEQPRTISQEARDFGAVAVNTPHRGTFDGTDEECILCCDNPMDCVASPCGHQMCCISCSEQLNGRCPVCSASCTFMRIYKS